MFSIKKTVTFIQTIKSSKFICYLCPVKNKDDVNTILESIKSKFPDANHVCYGYIIDSDMKYSDDKEPNKTAGAPILNVLTKKDLNMILAIVVRYFGGIKLGTGGLTRAYSSSVINALNEAEIIELTNGIELKLTFVYDNTKVINQYLKGFDIINTDYHDDITYTVNCSQEQLETLISQLQPYIKNYSHKNIMIEKNTSIN